MIKKIALQPDEGTNVLRRFLTPDEESTGYGIAAYIGARHITSRLYDFQGCKALAETQIFGDYAHMSYTEIMDTLADIFDSMSQQVGVPLSKLNVAVVSGTTAMEGKAAGIDPTRLQQDADAGFESFGQDVEYMLVGSKSIAVGQAFFTPCLSEQVGGGFLCALLAIDLLGANAPTLIVSSDPYEEGLTVLAYGNGEQLSVSVVSKDDDLGKSIESLLDACEAKHEHIEKVILLDSEGAEIPGVLQDRVWRVSGAVLDGTSAVLLSEIAEDELCRIVSTCRMVSI